MGRLPGTDKEAVVELQMIDKRKVSWTVPCFFFIAGFFMESVCAHKQCREERRINGMALQGFVFKKFSVRAFHECDISCERELTCQSYNYVVGEKSCELNNRTKEARPEHFRSDPARVYVPRFRNRVCGPVSVEDRNKIPDFRMTANSHHGNYYPYYGRLNESGPYEAWCPISSEPAETYYLQVDMGAVHSVCALTTQGERKIGAWTESFKVHLSTDGVAWSSYKENNAEKEFVGNTDENSIVKISLRPSKARFVRFYPLLHYFSPCLSVEIFVLK